MRSDFSFSSELWGHYEVYYRELFLHLLNSSFPTLKNVRLLGVTFEYVVRSLFDCAPPDGDQNQGGYTFNHPALRNTLRALVSYEPRLIKSRCLLYSI